MPAWSPARTRLIAAAVSAAVVLGAGAAALRLLDGEARDAAYGAARAEANDQAAILAAGLEAELDKFSLVPLVLADDSEVRDVLAAGSPRAPSLDRRFEDLATRTSAAAIYLMDTSGTTLAASNWRLATSFVGSDYSFRPYFRDAMRRGAATQFALGTVSGMPGLYIAQRVEAGGRPVGIVAVKVEFGDLEASWRKAGASVFVSDRDGVVLITSNEAWRFRTTRPTLEAQREPFRDERDFGVVQLSPLKVGTRGQEGAGAGSPLDANQPVDFSGWSLHLLIDPAQQAAAAITRARLYALLALLAAGSIAALALILKRRREARAQLLVEHRTHDLREQLGQANRLAILGQVTAGIGHEINQPVAAVQVFAENGAKLIDQGEVAEARSNFARIVEMVERIGRITSELRGFARRGNAEPERFPIGRVIDGALLLLRDRVERSGAAIDLPEGELPSLMVLAQPVRLEQVLVNLLQNALDAIEDTIGGAIAISLEAEARFCILRVADNGRGFAGSQDQLFQPFATTKPAGLGLGLVISRDIMRSLGGELSVEPAPGGAVLAMKVPRA